MAKVTSIKAKILASLKSDISTYYELKEDLEALKESIADQMKRANISEVKTDDYICTKVEISRSEIDAQEFYNDLPKRKKKKFPEMVNVVKSKASKHVGDDFIEDHSFITSTYDRLTVKKVRKMKRRR